MGRRKREMEEARVCLEEGGGVDEEEKVRKGN